MSSRQNPIQTNDGPSTTEFQVRNHVGNLPDVSDAHKERELTQLGIRTGQNPFLWDLRSKSPFGRKTFGNLTGCDLVSW